MGICFGSIARSISEMCMSQPEKYFQTTYRNHQAEFNALRMYEKEIRELLDVFNSIDTELCGWIKISALFNFVGIEENNFSRSVFSMYDMENTAHLCFRDFVVILWNICTLPPVPLVEYVFSMYDADGSRDIDIDEAREMCRDLYGDEGSMYGEGARVFRDLEVLTRKTVDLEMFQHFIKMNDSMMRTPKELQYLLRCRLLGMDFWIRTGKKRVEAFGPKLYISPELVFERYKASRYIPQMPAHVSLKKQKDKRRLVDDQKQEVMDISPPEKGSKAWKEMKLSKNNPNQIGRGLDGITIDRSAMEFRRQVTEQEVETPDTAPKKKRSAPGKMNSRIIEQKSSFAEPPETLNRSLSKSLSKSQSISLSKSPSNASIKSKSLALSSESRSYSRTLSKSHSQQQEVTPSKSPSNASIKSKSPALSDSGKKKVVVPVI